MNRFLFSCAVTLCMCGFAQNAGAAEIRAPLSDWRVGPIQAKSDSGARYCSMKNVYQDGQELVFARDDSGSKTSIALDIKQNTFKAGQSYAMLLRVGDVTQKARALAATPQVVVMQMGKNKPFYNAVRRKKSLSFSFDGKVFIFGLTGAAHALKALDECTGSLESGEPPAEALVPLRKENEIKDKTAFIPAVQVQQLAQKTAEKRQVERQAEVYRQEMDKMNAEISRLRETTEKLAATASSEREKRKAEIAQLTEENRKLELTARAEQEKNKNISQEMQRIAAAQKPVPSPVVPAKPVAGDAAETGSALKRLLEDSHIADGKIDVKSDLVTGVRNYHWISGHIFGGAQELPAESGQNFTQIADGYFKQAAAVCHGDFAKKIDDIKQAGSIKMQEAEMACMESQDSVAAAILFIELQGKFNIVTQEGTPAQMPEVLSKRDSIISAIFENKLN